MSVEATKEILTEKIRLAKNSQDLIQILEDALKSLRGQTSFATKSVPAVSPGGTPTSGSPVGSPRPGDGGKDVFTDDSKELKIGDEKDLKAKYEIKEDIELGSGATAVVKLCVEKKTGTELAIKMINKKNSSLDMKVFHEEILVLGALKHPNIIQLHDVYESDDYVYLITDLAFGGELFDRILQMKFFSELNCQEMCRKLFSAVAYIHKKGIAHRDLKPENILFATLDEDSALKISDFGFAVRLVTGGGKDKHGRRGTLLGTKGYAAPEVFSGSYDQKCDVWSLGVIVYILLCGVPPFVEYGADDQPEYTPFWIYQNKMESVPSKKVEFPERFFKHVSASAQDFLSAVLDIDPDKRPSAADALQHAWLNPLGPPIKTKSNLLLLNQEVMQKTLAAIGEQRTINRIAFVPGLDQSIKEKFALKWDSSKAKQVQTWIESVVGVTAPEGQTLQEFLQDGQHLCTLANKIQSGSVKKINTGKTPFVQRENISNFLKAAKDLGVRQEDLFVTVNLYEGSNMVTVVNTLFALAHRAKFVSGFKGPYLHIGGKVEKSAE